MKTPAPRTPEIVAVKRVDPRPLVGALLPELAVKDTLAALIPPHERHAVTVGEGMEALVLTLLTGEHALSRVADTLAGYELAVIVQRPLEAGPFHDNRLGRALAALWATGRDRLYGLVVRQAIPRYALELARLHTDATSLKVSGAYERDEGTAGPLLTCGYSRDHRPDLTPRRFGLTVTAEGVPVWGHITDGHQRDRTAHRFHLTQLRQPLPDLGALLLGADRKCFAGESMTLAAAPRFRFVPLGPQTVGLRQAWGEAPELSERPLLGEQPGHRQGERAQYRGASVVRPSRWKTAAGAGPEIALRLRGVESTPRAQAKAPRVAAAHQAEPAMRADLGPQWPRRTLAWEAEAHQAATLCLRERRLHQHQLTSLVRAAWVTAQRTPRGRPPQDTRPSQRQVWRVIWPGREATAASRRRAQRECRVVLATKVPAPQALSDAELRRAYQGQPAAALSCKGTKNPAAIAPIFLETPTRMAALGGVDLSALLVYPVIERRVRNARGAQGETLPDRPAPSQHPTGRTVFPLMRQVAIVNLVWAGQGQRQGTMRSADHLHVIRLLGGDRSIYTLPHQHSG